MSETDGKTDRPRLDAVGHSVLWRIRDAARYLGTIVPAMASSPDSFGDDGIEEVFLDRLRESMTPQRMNRLSVAHSAAEDGFKFLIRRSGASYPTTHNLMRLFSKLKACDPSTADLLDNAFAAVTAFYGTEMSDPCHRHLGSISDYLGKVGDDTSFTLMRYLELEWSVRDPALQYMHVEFHHEILCALDEVIQPRFGTIGDRVEYLARREFLRSNLMSHDGVTSEQSWRAYTQWFEEQGSFVEAMRKLTACDGAIGDEYADRVAKSVCNELTGHEDLALQAIAQGLVNSKPTQQNGVETRAHRPQEAGNWLVTTPAGDALGYMRPTPTGFWLATDDPSQGSPSWFLTERDARLHLAHLFVGELSIFTEHGVRHCRARSRRPHRTPHDRQWMSLHEFNWADPNTGAVLLRMWDARHGLRPGEFIKIDRDVGPSRGRLYQFGHVTDVDGHLVFLGESEVRSFASENA